MGKRKLDVDKGDKPSNVEVCFSKRRENLFKKAAELCILTDAEIATIAFSPHGNPFVFGHSSPDFVLDRFLDRTLIVYEEDEEEDEDRSQNTTIVKSHHHAAAAMAMSRFAQEIKGRQDFLEKQRAEKNQKQSAIQGNKKGIYYDDWFKIDEADMYDLEKLKDLRDERLEIRETIVARMRTASSSSSTKNSNCCSNGGNDDDDDDDDDDDVDPAITELKL